MLLSAPSARITVPIAQEISAQNANPPSLLTLMIQHAHRTVELATSPMKKQADVRHVIKIALYAPDPHLMNARNVTLVCSSLKELVANPVISGVKDALEVKLLSVNLVIRTISSWKQRLIV